MRKLFLLAIILGVLIMPCFSSAATDKYGLDTAAGQLKTQKIAGGSDVPSIIGGVVGVGLSLLGVAFFILILYSGFLWMTALGDKGKIDRAKDILESAIIGLLIVVAAYAIATFVFSNIAGGGGGTAGTTSTGTAASQDCVAAGGVCRLNMDDCNSNLGTPISGQCPEGYPICCTK